MKQKENKKENEPFFIVPSKVFDYELSPYELSVLFYLMMRSDNENHTCFPSEKGIAKACGMSHPTVTRVIKSLETKSIIKVKRQYAPTKNGTNRQTANLYTVLICEISPHTPIEAPPSSEKLPPIITEMREINKTKPNITKSNLTISTELSMCEAMEREKARFSFLDLKKECFEILKKERGLEEEYLLLLDRALEHLWFKNEAEYEGQKYTQDAIRDLLCAKVTPDILVASVEFLNVSKEPIRSPVAYLSKCILGGLVNGFLEFKRSEKSKDELDGMNGNPSFDADDFFAAAMRNSYGDFFKF